MILHIFLFILYSLTCGFLILRLPFVRKTGIRPALLLLFFGIHVAAGLIHNTIAWHFYPEHGDIWNFFQWSFLYRHRLTTDFHHFIADNAGWSHFTHNSIIWINMLLDLLSADNLAVNTLLFALPVFLGSIALFHTFRRHLPRTPLAALSTLLLPSVVFWTSCIHREGIIYMLIGFLCYSFSRLHPPTPIPSGPAAPTNTPPSVQPTSMQPSVQQSTHTQSTDLPSAIPNATLPDAARIPSNPTISSSHSNPSPTRQYLLIFFLLLLISYFRIVVTLSLLPGLFIWWTTQKQWRTRSILLSLTATLLLLALLLVACPSILDAIIDRQHEFLTLESHSQLPLPALEHSWHSLFRLIPQAFKNAFFQPLPGTGGQLIYTAFSLELLAIWFTILFSILIFLFLLFALKQLIKNTPLKENLKTPAAPFALFCITTSAIGLLLIGCMIPAVGAIVRYRSIYLPLLLAPSLYILKESRINRWLEKHIFIAPPTPQS